MAINTIEGRKLIQAVLSDSRSIRPGVNFLLEYCAKVCESPAWKQISELNFEKDGLVLQQWLNKTLTHHPPAENIRAFWFGLNNPILNDGETSCGLYVSGSTRFDANDETGDWACLKDDSYLPEGSYAKSRILHEIYFLVNQYEVGELGEYILCLGYACLAVKSACQSIDKRFLLGLYGPRPVAVGFDSGDFFFI